MVVNESVGTNKESSEVGILN